MKSNFYLKRMRQFAFIVLFSSLPLVSVAQTSSPKKGKCKGCVTQSCTSSCKKTCEKKEQCDTSLPSPSTFTNNVIAWIDRRVKYPVEAAMNGLQGKVMVRFDVETDGTVSNVLVAHSVDPLLDREAIRVISEMPKWKPAVVDGKAVKKEMILPVEFRLIDRR